jgi:hypothetical protein
MTATATAPLSYGSAGLAALLAEIGDGALERERANERPFGVIDRIREVRLGALRIRRPTAEAVPPCANCSPPSSPWRPPM